MNNIEGPIIAKFGGTSVATKDAILTIVEIVRYSLQRRPVLVVSAISGITDALLALSQIPKTQIKSHIGSIRQIHQSLVNSLFSDREIKSTVMNYVDEQLRKVEEVVRRGNLTPSDMDELVSFGEIISSYIIAQALQANGINAEQVIANRIIVTDDNFMQAEFLSEETERNARSILRPLLQRGTVPIITGFIGSTIEGQTTTLGRGGSDYSASIIGYCLGAKEVQIWTDVDGIYTADPKTILSARLIPEISYREASEMATFGAKVLHPRTIKPAIQKNIPVRILNTFHSDGSGTLITANNATEGLKAVSFTRKTTLINIYSVDMLLARGFLARIFEIFANRNISIDLVSVSEVSVSVTLDNVGQLNEAVKELERFCTVSVNSNFGIISLVGEKINTAQHLIKDVAELFHQYSIPIRMISLGASDTNISLVLDTDQVEEAVRLIHDKILIRMSKNIDSSQIGLQTNFAHAMEVT